MHKVYSNNMYSKIGAHFTNYETSRDCSTYVLSKLNLIIYKPWQLGALVSSATFAVYVGSSFVVTGPGPNSDYCEVRE